MLNLRLQSKTALRTHRWTRRTVSLYFCVIVIADHTTDEGSEDSSASLDAEESELFEYRLCLVQG